MFTKKRAFTLCFAAGLSALICGNAQATDNGTINFEGLILSDTCSIDVNDSGTTTGTVKMPAAYTSNFTAADDVGAQQTFKIKISGCDILANKIALNFDGTTDASNKEVLKIADTSTAKNIGIRLADTTGGRAVSAGKITFGTVNSFWQDNKNKDTPAAANEFDYTAQTVQVGDAAPTTGTYSATATFKVAYQ